MTNRIVLVAVLFALASAPANADPWPHRKPGLWQMTMTMQGSPMGPTASKYCIDAATESALLQQGQVATRKMCGEPRVHIAGNTGTIDAVCRFGKMTSSSHTAVTFFGNSAYRTETHSHTEPASKYLKADRVMTTDAKWIGPCPGNMKPGDIETANGMRIHLNRKAN